MVTTNSLGDVGEVARASRRHDGGQARGLLALNERELTLVDLEAALDKCLFEVLVERRNAVVVEACCRGTEDRHVLP